MVAFVSFSNFLLEIVFYFRYKLLRFLILVQIRLDKVAAHVLVEVPNLSIRQRATAVLKRMLNFLFENPAMLLVQHVLNVFPCLLQVVVFYVLDVVYFLLCVDRVQVEEVRVQVALLYLISGLPFLLLSFELCEHQAASAGPHGAEVLLSLIRHSHS